jgi:hypothetical protein
MNRLTALAMALIATIGAIVVILLSDDKPRTIAVMATVICTRIVVDFLRARGIMK